MAQAPRAASSPPSRPHHRVLQVVQPPLRRKDVRLVAAQFAGRGPAVAAQGDNDAVGFGVGHFHPLLAGLASGVVVAQGGGFVVYGVAQQVDEVAHMVGEVGVAPGVRALERPLLSGQMEHPRLLHFKACR